MADNNELLSLSLLPLVQNAPFAVYICDVHGRIVFFNEAAVTLLGRTPVSGEVLADILLAYHPDGAVIPHHKCPINRPLREKQGISGEEIKIQRPDRSFRNILMHSHPLFDKYQNLLGVHHTFVDITDQIKQRKRQKILAGIINSAEDAIIGVDLQSIIISWNLGALKIFGYQPDEIIGKRIAAIIPPERQGEEIGILQRIANGEQIRHFETVRVDKQGNRIPVSLTISPIKDEWGTVIGASKIAREITDEIANRKKMRNYTNELEKENTYKDQFVSLASHELKTPLTSAKAYAQLLMRAMDKGQKNFNLAAKTYHNLHKLEQLTNDLLDISKIKAGKISYRSDRINIKSLIKGSIENVQHTSQSHRLVPIHLDNAIIIGDPLRLEQVLVNLLNNAIKYSPDADKVEVAAKLAGDNIIVSVRDFGIGIPKESIELLFQRYFRVKDQAEKFPGLGIGLFISAEILKRHQGTFWIESELGKGSTFYFAIPVVTDQRESVLIDLPHHYKDRTIEVRFLKRNHILSADWKGILNRETIKKGYDRMAKMAYKYHCSKMLNNHRSLINPWQMPAKYMGDFWLPEIEKEGLKYIAFIPPAFGKSTSEEPFKLLKEIKSPIIMPFQDRKTAIAWLRKQPG